MAQKFSVCEILELGMEIEKNGCDFYSDLAGKAKTEELKTLFEFLAGQEETHISIFQNISKGLCDYNPQGAYPDEYFAYLRALAASYIFTQKGKGSEIARSIKDATEGIDLGIGFEKDSILFYEEMKKLVPDNDKEAIGALIEQERRHLEKLCEIKGGC